MHVLILHNQPVLADDHPDVDSDQEILETARVVARHLKEAGHSAECLPVGRDPALLIDACRTALPDVVFNLFEGLADHYDTEAYCVGLLEWLGIPYTGSPPQALGVARSKPLTKQLLRGAGLPTADFIVVDSPDVTTVPLDWPVIVKPAEQDASVGLDQRSVVSNLDDLNDRVGVLLERYGGTVLVEEFIRGRELSISVIETPELRTLPVSEILFVDDDPDFWPIVTYDAKWSPGTRDYEATPPKYPAEVSSALAARLESLAMRAFRLLGCRDYARIDFRVKPNGRPFILEINPNPCISPTGILNGGLRSAGLDHGEFVCQLAMSAFLRRNVVHPRPNAAVLTE